MKITEQTTFAELAAYLEELGNPFITMMPAAPGARHARYAIAYVSGVGTYHGAGATEAEALNDALQVLADAITRAREREVLQTRLGAAERAKRDPAFNKFRAHADQVCYGCSHTREEHPNDSGCQLWHSGPE